MNKSVEIVEVDLNRAADGRLSFLLEEAVNRRRRATGQVHPPRRASCCSSDLIASSYTCDTRSRCDGSSNTAWA